MTTIAYHQYTNIPYMSGGYASAPVSGPLSTNRTPLAMGKHNYGILSGIHPNPPQFGVADGASQFSNARHQYVRTASYAEQKCILLLNQPLYLMQVLNEVIYYHNRPNILLLHHRLCIFPPEKPKQ